MVKINQPDKKLLKALQAKIDQKTKPQGSLGRLEQLALQTGLIQQSVTPEFIKPCIVVFAGDHGIAREGVSAFPQEVTYQMVLNFLNGGAAINVFARQHHMDIMVVDAGVNHDFGKVTGLIDRKVAYGTESFLKESAMTFGQCQQALQAGMDLVAEIARTGTNVIGFGEMGIGNTAAASMLMHAFTRVPLADCVGKGTGINEAHYLKKVQILQNALEQNGIPQQPLEILSTYGGFEIAMICGAMLKAASLHMTVLVDGFIASSAYLVASQVNSNIRHYAFFCHQSGEKGHRKLLDFLDATPILSLNMRLGEGTGCAVAYPILESALKFLNEMASFESAGVSEKNG